MLNVLGRWRIPLAGVFTSLAVSLICNVSIAEDHDDDSPQFNLKKIKHVVVIYQENWSFDGLYSQFPGANGFTAGAPVVQVKKDGTPLTVLPPANGTDALKIPSNRPVTFFNLQQFLQPTDLTSDLVHRFYTEQLQINGGTMNKFVAWSDDGALVTSFFDASNLPEGKLAQEYTMCDNCFHSSFGGSFLNHQWLVAAQSPIWNSLTPPPASMISNPDSTSPSYKDGNLTPLINGNYYAINTSFSVNAPHPATANPATLIPNLDNDTIGERLNDKGISWAWFSGGWNNALAGTPDPLFQYHHQPFIYYRKYADGTALKAEHLKDETDFFTSLQNHTLPAVSFIKPLGPDNEHPGYASLQQGQQHVADIVEAVKNSPYWKHTAIIVTYDENGGRWDHVAPPVKDSWGPGTRVPLIVISPLAKKHFVDHTSYETLSILRLIEERWKLKPLSDRDARANDLRNAFKISDQELLRKDLFDLKEDEAELRRAEADLARDVVDLEADRLTYLIDQWFHRNANVLHRDQEQIAKDLADIAEDRKEIAEIEADIKQDRQELAEVLKDIHDHH